MTSSSVQLEITVLIKSKITDKGSTYLLHPSSMKSTYGMQFSSLLVYASHQQARFVPEILGFRVVGSCHSFSSITLKIKHRREILESMMCMCETKRYNSPSRMFYGNVGLSCILLFIVNCQGVRQSLTFMSFRALLQGNNCFWCFRDLSIFRLAEVWLSSSVSHTYSDSSRRQMILPQNLPLPYDNTFKPFFTMQNHVWNCASVILNFSPKRNISDLAPAEKHLWVIFEERN